MPNNPDHPASGDDSQSAQPEPRRARHHAQTGADESRQGIKWSIVWAVIIGVGSLIGAASIFYEAAHYVDEKVDKTVEARLSDDATLRKIAGQLRPSLIFNGRESIISDMGASQYVKDIKVTRGTDPDSKLTWPTSVHIELDRYFGNPIVTPMADSAYTTPRHGKGLSWDFDIAWIVAMGDTNDAARLYRLELIP